MQRPCLLMKILISLCVLGLFMGGAAPKSAAAARFPAADGGRFTKVLDSGIETLDPHMAYDVNSFESIGQVYETLLTYQREDPTELIPLLAESWHISDGGLTYTFTLRRGITFHAGGLLEAHDAAYSFWRGLLQDYEYGPVTLIIEALFGVNHIDELPGDDLARCQMVKNAVTYDDQNSQITFHLESPYAPFASLLAGPYSSLLDQEWMIAQGDWDASCDTWRDWYNPQVEDSVLYEQMNGTGPFRLVSWDSDMLHLESDPQYWRVEPLWPGASSGAANLQDVYFIIEEDAETRGRMLLDGTVDSVGFSAGFPDQFGPHLWGVFDGYEDQFPDLVDAEHGILKEYANLANMRQFALLFNYQITEDGNPFILSGALDGNGIPSYFFSDIHVRKAFSHAVDWQRVIDNVYGAQAIRAQGPIPMGEIGFDPDLEPYLFDLALAEDELKLAFGGALWTNGFKMILPVWGNPAFMNLADQLKTNLESIAPTKIDIQIAEFTYQEMLDFRNHGFVLLWYAGWMEDYHHPHNWVTPYLSPQGYFNIIQHFPAALAALFYNAVQSCVVESEPGAMLACYQNLQGLSHENAAAMWGIQTVFSDYLRAEVRGYYHNPALIAPPLYELSKGAVPTARAIVPGVPTGLDFDFANGAVLQVALPAGAFNETGALVFTPDTDVDERAPGGLFRGGIHFDLMFCPGNKCTEPYVLGETADLKLHYTDQDVRGLIEDKLYIFTWNGKTWVDVVEDCGGAPLEYARDPATNTLGFPVCHFSRFVLTGESHTQYLPVLRK
ncbi:MAG TPA: ABC transporter substrate-binding protein [Anaerolineaceae bacterium]|nr:ABC transporter substrate-binding protein [Anaerolineaceae bacterium]